jgi:hypothetical protein
MIKAFSMKAYEKVSQPLKGRYIIAKARGPKTVKFIARLEREKSIKVKAAFESGLVYTHLVLLVSSGNKEGTIFSPARPFSKEARKQLDARLENLKVDI